MAQSGYNYSRQGSTNAYSIPSRLRRVLNQLLCTVLQCLLHLRFRARLLGYNHWTIRRALASPGTRRVKW